MGNYDVCSNTRRTWRLFLWVQINQDTSFWLFEIHCQPKYDEKQFRLGDYFDIQYIQIYLCDFIFFFWTSNLLDLGTNIHARILLKRNSKQCTSLKTNFMLVGTKRISWVRAGWSDLNLQEALQEAKHDHYSEMQRIHSICTVVRIQKVSKSNRLKRDLRTLGQVSAAGLRAGNATL